MKKNSLSDNGEKTVTEKKEQPVVVIKQSKFKSLIIFALVIAVIFCVIIGIISINNFKPFGNSESSLSVDNLIAELKTSSELVTATVNFKGYSEYTDEGIPIINSGDFVMVYHATVKAGIDVKKVKIAVDNSNKTVNIFVPSAEIMDVKVDSKSVKYYNTQFALFNTDEKEDAADAISKAEEQAQEDALGTGILELADQQSKTLIKGILEDVVNGYKMEFFRNADVFSAKEKELESNTTE